MFIRVCAFIRDNSVVQVYVFVPVIVYLRHNPHSLGYIVQVYDLGPVMAYDTTHILQGI